MDQQQIPHTQLSCVFLKGADSLRIITPHLVFCILLMAFLSIWYPAWFFGFLGEAGCPPEAYERIPAPLRECVESYFIIASFLSVLGILPALLFLVVERSMGKRFLFLIAALVAGGLIAYFVGSTETMGGYVFD